jgi:uncharacterized protein YndB with AHSA1/START domain
LGNPGVAERKRVGEPITRTIELAQPPTVVWSAITSSGELAAWFGADAEVHARRGGAVRFRWSDGSERRGIVEVADAPRRFAFRWREVVRDGAGTRVGEVSHVMFELEPSPAGGTRLRVTEVPGIAPVDAIGMTPSPLKARPPSPPRLLVSRG